VNQNAAPDLGSTQGAAFRCIIGAVTRALRSRHRNAVGSRRMAISLTPAHRSWRARVFVATWLSYVGFYFCRQPFSKAKGAIAQTTHWDTATLGNIWAAYLIAYALGQFLASRMGPRLGPRRNVLLGMAVSVAVTVAMGVAPTWPVMAALVALNGLAQATGWSGNVGTMASWFHKHERGRIMGVWSTNFTVGALVPGWVIAAVLGVAPWPWCFYTGAAVLAVVWGQFYVLQRNRPEDLGLAPIDDPVTAGATLDEAAAEPSRLSRDAWINVLLVGGFYFFIKLIRYGVWSWVPYFLKLSYGLGDSQAALFSTVFDLAGLPGVLVIGWLSDRYFGSRRGGISLIMTLGAVVSTGLLIALGGASVTLFIVLLGAIGFFLYGPDSLLTGAGAIDIGNRRLATFATAMISGLGSLGAVVQEFAISRNYKPGEGLGVVFAMLFGSAVLAAVFCAALVWRNRRGKGI
jgi:MFS transporter, OPA family, glycerol-3-phosphate transporter